MKVKISEVASTGHLSKIEKLPRGIQGEQSSKDMASSTITSINKGQGYIDYRLSADETGSSKGQNPAETNEATFYFIPSNIVSDLMFAITNEIVVVFKECCIHESQNTYQ